MIGQQVSGCEIILGRTVEITAPQKVQEVLHKKSAPNSSVLNWYSYVPFRFPTSIFIKWVAQQRPRNEVKTTTSKCNAENQQAKKIQQTEGGKPFGQISKCSKTNKPNRVYIPCAATHTELRSQRHPLKMMNFLGRFMDEARHFQTLIT